jgi:hypothetical protein
MDQTPPEKMTLEQTIKTLRQTESGLAYLAKVMWSEGESTEAVAMEQHVRNVQSALLHLEGAQADKGWQPIETAPRDGTEILGWREDCGTLLIRWTSPAEFLTKAELDNFEGSDAQQEDWFCADFVHGSRLEREEVPTHWRSIPEPPDSAMAAQTEGERP